MKKIIIMVVSLMMVLALTGCQGVNSKTDKKALLVVSFGSSFVENRVVSIDALEEELGATFSEYDAFNAFTSQMIIDIYKERDQVTYKNVEEQIEHIYKKGYGEVLVVPTHVINGEEYDQMNEALHPFKDKFEILNVSKPLLSSVEDYTRVIEAMMDEVPDVDEKTAVVLMGHGTHHDANSAYPALDYAFKHAGYPQVFIGTVEGSPSFEDVAKDIEQSGYEKVLLMPLMIVAGDHAYNDMAGDEEDSWKVMFKAKGYDVDYVLKGLGELSSIRELFVQHANEALVDEK
ncbi:sirohydrochlorin cobaltochelatase [Vallitalea pronyensis]|nr:sirohydrochlorin cobaltochelatase [Vallitalea pronyensis]